MRITFNGPYNHSSKKFKCYSILPTIEFIIDKQLEDNWINKDNVIEKGYIEYSIGILWLKFAFWLNIEI